MKIYFLSSQPCALTVNDGYFGRTDLFARTAELCLKDKLFIRFTPENAQPIAFFLTEDIRFQPPEGCEVYLLKDGIAVYAYDFPPRDCTLKPITQAKREDTLVTVFMQGRVQAAIQTRENFFTATLPPSFSVCEIFFEKNFTLLKSPDSLVVIAPNGVKVLQEKVLSFTVQEGVLHATFPLLDSLGRIAQCRYELIENELIRTQFTVKQARTKTGETDEKKILAELLPYAFFESVLLGADYASMLSDELAPKAGALTAFLGEFTAVVPTDEASVCGLVRQKAERLFEVYYYTVEVENGKICDIKL